jgi:transposase InsO family protein
MSADNPLWGAPRIHGELLKLGFEVAQSTVSKYMVRRHGGPSGQSWWTFLRNHAPEIAAMDLFVVPTLAFNLLYGFIIVRLDRRELVHIAVTNSPTADWIARQITEAFPWDAAPGYLIRDRDCVFGSIVRHRVCAMGIRDKPIAPRSPWQNGFAERLIGSIRRECLDQIIVCARSICAGLCSLTRATTTELGRTGHSTKTRRCIVRFSALAPQGHILFSADCITNTSESSFRYKQA